MLLIALVATLAGTAATLVALRYLLTPVILTSTTLRNYRDTQAIAALPMAFTDEAGTLMANTTQTLHELDRLMRYIRHYDNLTGFPNRDFFRQQLYQIANQSGKDPAFTGLLLVRIDEYATLLQALDRDLLDSFVRTFAQRLKSCVKLETLIGRISPSEFAIALFEIPTFESLIELAQLILSTQAKLFQIGETPIRATASIGITMGEIAEICHADKLLQQAQIALAEVKSQGYQQFRFYSPDMNAQLQERLALEHDLHGALERGEFTLHYQPLVDLHSGRVQALEALLRWQHPKRGLISPDKFIPIAEANGEIVTIGEWVLRTACAQARRWQASGCETFRISINLSARQFEQDDLVAIVDQVLRETELAPRLLELEVTESFLMSNVQRSAETLRQLKAVGVVIALDDFGTGYSSLNYLNRFPINMLKIDRSFVRDLTPHSDAAAIIDAIIALAQSLNLSITAEGVETVEQLCYLQEKGCDEGQGYFFSRPLAVEAVLPVLKSSFQPQLRSCTLQDSYRTRLTSCAG